MARGRRPHLDTSILEAALIGLQHQRDQISAKMESIRNQLGVFISQSPLLVAGSTLKKQIISLAGRKRIAAAQKKRWAEQRRSQAAPEKKRTISAAGRKRISAAARRRWAKFRAQKAAAQKTLLNLA